MEYLVIDGYNVINAWRDLFDLNNEPLEDCREKFLNLLSNYQGFKNTKIIVVFDAHMVKGSQEKEEVFDNITVVFTKENVTADNYIERFVYKMGQTNKVRVVTSDYLEQRTVFRSGGIRVSPRELRQEIIKTAENLDNVMPDKGKKTNTIMSRLDPEVLERLEKLRRGK